MWHPIVWKPKRNLTLSNHTSREVYQAFMVIGPDLRGSFSTAAPPLEGCYGVSAGFGGFQIFWSLAFMVQGPGSELCVGVVGLAMLGRGLRVSGLGF